MGCNDPCYKHLIKNKPFLRIVCGVCLFADEIDKKSPDTSVRGAVNTLNKQHNSCRLSLTS